jgi:HK97 gp10 family phage protein
MADSNIIGGRELDAALQSLSVKVEKNILRSALRQGANQFKEAIQANIPVDSGALRRSVRVTTNSKKGRVTASVKIGNKTAWYGAMVEFGTRPHKITANGGALVIGTHRVASVDHPGSRPKPFARPAFDQKWKPALAAVGAQLRRRLTAEGINIPDEG